MMAAFGFDPAKTVSTLRSLPRYFGDLRALSRQQRGMQSAFPLGKLYPCLEDRGAESGNTDNVYFHQDLLVARRIHANRPVLHVDVGSRLDGLVAHVASYRQIEVMDIRPLSRKIANVRFLQQDLTADLPEDRQEYCDSLSCLHALEHFGLGRYGDPIRWNGHEIGFRNLASLLKLGGKLYLSVPIGPRRIEFNAHRVFAVQDVLDLVAGRFRVDHFSYIDDGNELHEDVELAGEAVAGNFGCRLGCGIFELTKVAPLVD